MISINIPESDLKKIVSGKSFWILKPILKRKIPEILAIGSVIQDRRTLRKFQILKIRKFNNIVEALKHTDFKMFKMGNSKEAVFKYYNYLYPRANSKRWCTLLLNLKEIIEE